MEFIMPPVICNAGGAVRTVGFELEFGAVNLKRVAEIIISLFGGQAEKSNRFLMKVTGTSIGDFQLKMDSRIMTEKKYEPILSSLGINTEGEEVIDFVESFFSIVIPYELGTPPLPITRISEFEKLRRELFRNKAKGTRKSLLTAFATHINTEYPSPDPASILSYLRAFLLLYPLIFEKAEIHITRRIYQFIEPFPDDYTALVLDPYYHPGLKELIYDYRQYNPNRNRPLDLYPAFACLDAGLVNTFKDIGSVKPRPAFHYRLPNSEVDNADWCLADEWNSWLLVERLAADPGSIEILSRDFLKSKHKMLFGFDGNWSRHMEKWMEKYEQKTS
jgi:hypothetical protein